jgi:hypothetical protein
MADSTRETRPPDLPRPTAAAPDVPRPAVAAVETREAAHQSTADAVRAEYLAATDERQTREERIAERGEPSEADESPEVLAALVRLAQEGHGPGRHHDPTNRDLFARLGTPTRNADGSMRLDRDGFVESQNKIDPMSGSTVDAVTGLRHRCGPIATRIDSAADYAKADAYMKEELAASGVLLGSRPISEVLGPEAEERMTGLYLDPADPSQAVHVDFTEGTIFASYSIDEHGNKALDTLYAEPVPFNPSDRGTHR